MLKVGPNNVVVSGLEPAPQSWYLVPYPLGYTIRPAPRLSSYWPTNISYFRLWGSTFFFFELQIFFRISLIRFRTEGRFTRIQSKNSKIAEWSSSCWGWLLPHKNGANTSKRRRLWLQCNQTCVFCVPQLHNLLEPASRIKNPHKSCCRRSLKAKTSAQAKRHQPHSFSWLLLTILIFISW